MAPEWVVCIQMDQRKRFANWLHCSYLTVIKKPMDLSTIRAKLDNGMYISRQDFVSDIRLIITNCYTYNSTPASPVRKAGEAFEKLFNTCKENKTDWGG